MRSIELFVAALEDRGAARVLLLIKGPSEEKGQGATRAPSQRKARESEGGAWSVERVYFVRAWSDMVLVRGP